MHQGNWKCSKCGGVITELPFEPKSEVGLTCRSCYAKSKSDSGGGASASAGKAGNGAGSSKPSDQTTRPQFSGDWKCSGCGKAITSLPFEPRSTNNLKCLDCFKNSRA